MTAIFKRKTKKNVEKEKGIVDWKALIWGILSYGGMIFFAEIVAKCLEGKDDPAKEFLDLFINLFLLMPPYIVRFSRLDLAVLSSKMLTCIFRSFFLYGFLYAPMVYLIYGSDLSNVFSKTALYMICYGIWTVTASYLQTIVQNSIIKFFLEMWIPVFFLLLIVSVPLIGSWTGIVPTETYPIIQIIFLILGWGINFLRILWFDKRKNDVEKETKSYIVTIEVSKKVNTNDSVSMT